MKFVFLNSRTLNTAELAEAHLIDEVKNEVE